MPKATLPNKLYRLSLDVDVENYPDESTRPTFLVIMPTMEEQDQLGEFYDLFKADRYNRLKDLHDSVCEVVSPLIKNWQHFTDRDGNAIAYSGAESLKKVLVLSEVAQLVQLILELGRVTFEEKKTSEPLH